jgi:hypothetical protein
LVLLWRGYWFPVALVAVMAWCAYLRVFPLLPFWAGAVVQLPGLWFLRTVFGAEPEAEPAAVPDPVGG